MIPEAIETEAPPIVNAMTIDVEDYFHVSAFDGVLPRSQWAALESRVYANTERVLAILDEAGVIWTFFVLGWVAERHRSLVRRIAARGHEIASHGYAHRLVYDQSPAAFREDVRRAKHLLEDIAAVRVQGFRAPSYSITPRSLWAFDVLIEEGYRYDASVFPIHHDPTAFRCPPAGPTHRASGGCLAGAGVGERWCGVNLPVGGAGRRPPPYA